MNIFTQVPRHQARLDRLSDLEQKYKGFKMFQAEKLLYSGKIFHIAKNVPGGDLSGRLYIYFNISGFTLYLMNGYLQPLGEEINNVFHPSPLGQFYLHEIETVITYLYTHGLYTDIKTTQAPQESRRATWVNY